LSCIENELPNPEVQNTIKNKYNSILSRNAKISSEKHTGTTDKSSEESQVLIDKGPASQATDKNKTSTLMKSTKTSSLKALAKKRKSIPVRFPNKSNNISVEMLKKETFDDEGIDPRFIKEVLPYIVDDVSPAGFCHSCFLIYYHIYIHTYIHTYLKHVMISFIHTEFNLYILLTYI